MKNSTDCSLFFKPIFDGHLLNERIGLMEMKKRTQATKDTIGSLMLLAALG
jgi:hypothetical protein